MKLSSNLNIEPCSTLDDNHVICEPVVSWSPVEERGQEIVQLKDEPDINTPAVAAAFAVKSYEARDSSEISLEVGDLISVIEMPSPGDSIWWRGKRGFEVGFFPGDCVQTIREATREGVTYPILNFPETTCKQGPASPETMSYPSFGHGYCRASLRNSNHLNRKNGRLSNFFRSLGTRRERDLKMLGEEGNSSHRVFGCALSEHLASAGSDVPKVLQWCSSLIEESGIVDGIYRLSGRITNIDKLRGAFEEGRVPDTREDTIIQDVHCVASLLKMYFRELPDPLLTYQLYDDLIQCLQPNYPDEVSIASEATLPESCKIENLRRVIHRLPPDHFKTLEYLMRHLNKVASFGDKTGMTSKNVAIVWAPNLLRCRNIEAQEGVAALHLIGIQAVLIEYLIRHVDVLFQSNQNDEVTKRTKDEDDTKEQIPSPSSSRDVKRNRIYSCTEAPTTSRLINVGNPHTPPPKYHTVIETISKGRHVRRSSSSGWTSIPFLASGYPGTSANRRLSIDLVNSGGRLRVVSH